MRKAQGFTLIELMIVVAVIGVLAAIAIPNYTEYIQRSKVAEALSGLSLIATKLEQHYQDNRAYPATCPAAGTAAVAALPPNTNNFTFACVGDATSFTATATGVGTMTGFTYTINQANAKSTTTTAATGWGAATTACWVKSKGGGC